MSLDLWKLNITIVKDNFARFLVRPSRRPFFIPSNWFRISCFNHKKMFYVIKQSEVTLHISSMYVL